MVFDNPIEEPNLSYVRVNLKSSPVGSAPAGNVPGTGESVKCSLVKTMSRSDPQVVNAALLHRSMMEAEPIPKPSVPLWTPEHLYASGEKRLLRYSKVEWKEIGTEEFPTKPEVRDVRRKAPIRGRKGCSKEMTMNLKNHNLERSNSELKVKVDELERKIEVMSKVMKDPKKLRLLIAHLQELRRSNEAKVASVSTPHPKK